MKQAFKVQAREIIRSARRQGITLTRWPESNLTTKVCATAVIRGELEGDTIYDSDRIADLLNMPRENVLALSYGFEGYTIVPDHIRKNRYYKVGQRVAAMVGLPTYDS